MNSSFYRDFEDRFRGSRELIKSRLQVYLPFVEQLKTIHQDCQAVDLACGRGEWLEVLRDTNVAACGVDLDNYMLEACREIGLNVVHGDALDFLKSLPSESQDIVSAFHFVEHIPFEDLRVYIQEAHRVLRPAGLLIFETQNPENLRVGSSSFYLDPTHRNPIPPLQLTYLSEYYGFYRTKVLRLQESPELATEKAITLLDVLDGVSPDYSIVSQKAGAEEDLARFNQLFEKEYGLTLSTLANRYDEQLAKKVETLDKIHDDLINAQTDFDVLRLDINNLRADMAALREELKIVRDERDRLRDERDRLRTELIEAKKELKNQERLRFELEMLKNELANSRAETASICAQAEELKLQYVNILYSQSYRITAPLRSILIFIKRLQKTASKQSPDQSISIPSGIANKPDIGLSNQDAQYFNDLLQREIAKRRNKDV